MDRFSDRCGILTYDSCFTAPPRPLVWSVPLKTLDAVRSSTTRQHRADAECYQFYHGIGLSVGGVGRLIAIFHQVMERVMLDPYNIPAFEIAIRGTNNDFA